MKKYAIFRNSSKTYGCNKTKLVGRLILGNLKLNAHASTSKGLRIRRRAKVE